MNYNILSFLIPTNKPEELKTKFYTTLKVFDAFKEYITFCFNFQPPYTQEEINDIVQDLTNKGFKVAYTQNEYNWTPATFSFITMRNDAAKVAPKDTLYFVDFDDDIVYYKEHIEEAQKLWLNGILFLLQNPQCGVLRIDSKFDSFPLLQKNTIYYILSEYGRTGLGLIYKNVYNNSILPKKYLKLTGYCEDQLEMLQRAKDGYKIAALINKNIGYHTEFKSFEEHSRNKYHLVDYEDDLNSIVTYKKQLIAEFQETPEKYGYNPRGSITMLFNNNYQHLNLLYSIEQLKEQINTLL
jgi:hypothetical protein